MYTLVGNVSALNLRLISDILNTSNRYRPLSKSLRLDPYYFVSLINALEACDVGIKIQRVNIQNLEKPQEVIIEVDDTFTDETSQRLEDIRERALQEHGFNKLGLFNIADGELKLPNNSNILHWVVTGVCNTDVEHFLKYDKSKTQIKRIKSCPTVSDGTYRFILRRAPLFQKLIGVEFSKTEEFTVTILHSGEVVKILELEHQQETAEELMKYPSRADIIKTANSL